MTRPHTKLRPILTYTLETAPVSPKAVLQRATTPAVVPISFTSAQLDKIMAAARSVPIESRDAFLRLIAEQLKIRDIDVVDAIFRALRYMNRAA
jgi:hypothetical protein